MVNHYDVITAVFLFILLVTVSVPLGKYMAGIYSGNFPSFTAPLRRFEKLIYRLIGTDEAVEMDWKVYAKSFAVFNIIGIIFLFFLQMAQGILPLNPRGLPGVRWDTAFNTAVSYVTNTNWQSYGGESTMSYFTQMAGLAVQNFLSAGIGMAAGAAMVRGFIRKETGNIGNIWVDLTRSVLYILLPLSIAGGILLMSQGVIQNLNHYVTAHTLEGIIQVIPQGPAASQIAIKQIGSNGGGFFHANSAHPFENPTMFSNLLENFFILLVPMAFIFMFGYIIKKTKQGKTLFVAMLILFIIGLATIMYFEYQPNPALERIGVSGQVNMEGKETRFGVFWPALWSQSTTATSNGSVNGMHESFMPMGGLVQMFNMGIGEVVFGGVGSGLIGLIFYIILSMFVAGLMIGRTPEFLGKKFGPFEMVMSMISMLLPMISMVIFSAVAVSTETGISGLNNPSSRGLSGILYAFTSGHGNNGSSFAGLNSNTLFYNISLGGAMLIGRFASIIPALAVAGSLSRKKIIPETIATFPTTGAMFIIILICVIIITGALTFFPVYSLGPILEHLFVNQGKLF